MKYVATLAGLLICALSPPPAVADDNCTPKLVASLDMTPTARGLFTVPVTFNGEQHRVVVETDSIHSALNGAFVAQAGFQTKPIAERVSIEMAGALASSYAVVPTFGIDKNTGADIAFIVDPSGEPVHNDIVGSIGMDLLGNFDLDLDFKANKLNLFSSNSCEGGGVYWSKTYQELPLDMSTGRANTQMVLDGKDVSVTMATGSTISYMRADVAKALFGITPTVQNDVQTPANIATAPANYFKSLEGGGLSIGRPAIALFGDPNAPPCDNHRHHHLANPTSAMTVLTTCYSNGQVTLGLREMRQLHLYLAFKAGKVYFTAADAN